MKQARSLSIGFVFCLLLLAEYSFCQAPESINYQAVARDNNGNPIANQSVRFRMSILEDEPGGIVVYSENHLVTTNSHGLTTLSIGEGNYLSGGFSNIKWGEHAYYLQTEIDASGGTAYQLMGTSQFVSVPYALYAKSSGGTTDGWSINGNSGTDPSNHFFGTTDNTNLAFRTNNILRMYITTKGQIMPVNTGYSVFLGEGAGGNDNLNNNQNVFVGTYAGSYNYSGKFNTALGSASLQRSITGSNNTATGNSSLTFNTSGNDNTAGGVSALALNTTGGSNTATGYESLLHSTTGTGNTAHGRRALYTNTTGHFNTALGYNADVSSNNLYNATALGYKAVATASHQVRLGNDSVTSLLCKGAYASTSSNPPNMTVDENGQIMRSTTSGSTGWSLTGNSGTVTSTNFIGTTDNKVLNIRTNNILRARITIKGQIETFSTGYSVFLGEQAGAADNLSDNYNTFLGYKAGRSNNSGKYGTAVGSFALSSNTTGSSNTATGISAMENNTTGNENTASGVSSLTTNTTGGSNTANGFSSLAQNSTGIGNSAQGSGALFNNTTGNFNTALGYQADVNSGNYYNATAIGYRALATSSQQIRLGNDSVTSLVCKGAYAATTTSSPNLAVDANGQIMRSTVGTANWSLNGNSGTVPGTNFIGTSDSLPVTFKTNNQEVARMTGAGQMAVGTTSPDNSALVDMASTTKGVLLPRMNKIALSAIANPADGLLVYCTDCGNNGAGRMATWVNGEWKGFVIDDCLMNPLPSSPNAGIHTATQAQIIWRWNSVSGASGYRWNTTNDYVSAVDLGSSTCKFETGLTYNTNYTRFVWAYNTCGISLPRTLTQTTLVFSCGDSLTIIHTISSGSPVDKTITYQTIRPNNYSNLCWITQNLGADQQATSWNDPSDLSSGWFYKFGSSQGWQYSEGTLTPSSSLFINSPNNSGEEWSSQTDPCRIAFGNSWTVAPYTFFTQMQDDHSWITISDPWNCDLKLHAAGYLGLPNGLPIDRGINGYYWSRNPSCGTNPFLTGWSFLFVSNLDIPDNPCFPVSLENFIGMQGINSGFGMPIRCLRELPY